MSVIFLTETFFFTSVSENIWSYRPDCGMNRVGREHRGDEADLHPRQKDPGRGFPDIKLSPNSL